MMMYAINHKNSRITLRSEIISTVWLVNGNHSNYKFHVVYFPVASNVERDKKKGSIKKFEIMWEMDETDKLNGLFDK